MAKKSKKETTYFIPVNLPHMIINSNSKEYFADGGNYDQDGNPVNNTQQAATTGPTDTSGGNTGGMKGGKFLTGLGQTGPGSYVGDWIDKKTTEDDGHQNAWDAQAAGYWKGTSKGAQMGQSFGPWGMLIGAAVGGTVGGISGHINADKKNKEIGAAKRTQASELEQNVVANPYARAYGGPLNLLMAYGGDKTNPDVGPRKVDKIPDGYVFSHEENGKKIYKTSTESGVGTSSTVKTPTITPGTKQTNDPQAYFNQMKALVASGTHPNDLVIQGKISKDQVPNLMPHYQAKQDFVYLDNPPMTTTSPASTEQFRDKRIMRQEVKSDNGGKYKTYMYPDNHAGYTKSTTVYIDPATDKQILPEKSFDEKGNYKPFFNPNPIADVYENTVKSDIPGTNPLGATATGKVTNEYQDYGLKANDRSAIDTSGKNYVSRAGGGPLPNQSVEDYNEYNGNKHEQGGIPAGQNAEVEGGEVNYKNYIFSDRLTPEGRTSTFASIAKRIKSKYKDRESDAAANRALEQELSKLAQKNEAARKVAEVTDKIKAQQQDLNDVLKYGGCLKYENGGFHVGEKQHKELVKISRKRGIPHDDFLTNLYANTLQYGLGGLKTSDQTNVEDAKLQSQYGSKSDQLGLISQYAEGGPKYGPEVSPDYIDKLPLVDSANLMHQYVQNNQDQQLANDTANMENNMKVVQGGADSYDGSPKTKKGSNFKFGNEELAFAMSNLPAFYNMMQGMKPAKTEYKRVKPDLISLDSERRMIENQGARASRTAMENARTTGGGGSGSVLAALAATTSSINDNVMDALSRSYQNEANANTEIKNRANYTNTDIANREIETNMQNKAMAKSLIGLGLSDISNNSQGYLRDKKLKESNVKANAQQMQIINQLFPNYKWGVDPSSDKLMLQYVSSTQKES